LQALTTHTARVLHGAFVAGVLMILATLAVVRGIAPLEFSEPLPQILRYAGFAQLLIVVTVINKLSARIERCGRDEDQDGWWAAHSGRVLVLWALTEGAAVSGAVFWYLTGDLVVLFVVTGLALLFLLRLGPLRWMER
jgi:hypothetical protein